VNPLKLITTGLFLFILVSLRAQTGTTTPNELYNKYKPNESSPFSQLTRKAGEEVESDLSNAFKYCPTMLFRQKIMFFYERKLVNGFTMNLGIGKAFGNDPIQSAFFTQWQFDSDNQELGPDEFVNYGEYYGSGVMISAGARIYFAGEAFDGGFVEFNYRHDRLSYQLPSTVNGMRVEGSPIADLNMSNFNFGFGFTNISGKRGRAVHELALTVGIKNFTYTRYAFQDNSFVSGQPGDAVYKRSTTDGQARIAPSIHISYCFGYGW
jgi:hypothetical protein